MRPGRRLMVGEEEEEKEEDVVLVVVGKSVYIGYNAPFV